MDNRAIGFFDSGLGGLTCIPNLFSQIPNEHVIYFGDTARTPYGSKAVSEHRKRSRKYKLKHNLLLRADAVIILFDCLFIIINKADEAEEHHYDQYGN